MVEEVVPPEEWRECAPVFANLADQRKFWSISLLLSSIGLLFSSLVIWEFVFNTALQYPNTMMQGFAAFALPDFVLALVNTIVYIESLVNGDSLGYADGITGRSETGCLVVAFITYIIVVCTYFAPMMVALFTFLKFNAVSKGDAGWSLKSPIVYSVCLGLPITLGTILAAIALSTQLDGASVLGSWRQLYCYIRRYDSRITGDVILGLFVASCILTLLFYMLTVVKVAAIVSKS